jgi:hypothetical protein
MNWAVYRAFTRGEMRYYRAIEQKVRTHGMKPTFANKGVIFYA